MNIQINRHSKTPAYKQIRNQIRQKILSGELSPGCVLAPERKLSEMLGVNRTTVNKAYLDLKSEGLIHAVVGKGTLVTGQLSDGVTDEARFVPSLQWHQLTAPDLKTALSGIIKQVMSAGENGTVISLAGGFVNERYLNVSILEGIMSDCFKKYGGKLFMPTSVYGLLELRQTLEKKMARQGIRAVLNQIMVTSGSQQALEYCARSLLQPGDMVIVEAPTYVGAIEIFKSRQAQVVGIPMDEAGMRIDILEKYLLKYRPKLIYTIPTFQNPSGITMSLERRKALLELAYLYRIPIIEDDPYSDILLEGNALPSIKALDSHGYVIYIGTVSKSIFMGLRIGWVIADERLIETFGAIKQVSDLHTNTMGQYFVMETMKRGVLEEHIEKMIAIYRHKKTLMKSTIDAYRIEGFTVYETRGGFYLWCKLPQNVVMKQFVTICHENGVAIMPGEAFFPEGTTGENFIRLNYSAPEDDEITEGIRRMMQALKRTMRQRPLTEADVRRDKPWV